MPLCDREPGLIGPPLEKFQTVIDITRIVYRHHAGTIAAGLAPVEMFDPLDVGAVP